MLADLNKRHAERLWRISKRWGGPSISGWFVIGPTLLLIAIVAFALMGATEFVPFLAILLGMVIYFGFLMWVHEGFYRLLDEKETEIGRLQAQIQHGKAGHDDSWRN